MVKKKWIVAIYKTNQLNRLEHQLSNQKFEYFLPKIYKKQSYSNHSKEEILFPGYIFVNTSFENYLAIKYTIGIKDILKFGENISCISNGDITTMKMIEESSKKSPIKTKLKIGQEVILKEGSFKGILAKIYSLPSKERVDVLLSLFGSSRKVNIPMSDLVF